MDNQLVTTDLIEVDNIKDYFSLYYWTRGFYTSFKELPKIKVGYRDHRRGNSNVRYKSPLTNKFTYIFQEQTGKMFKFEIEGEDILSFIKEKIAIGLIPRKYEPKIIQLKNVYTKRIKLDKVHQKIYHTKSKYLDKHYLVNNFKLYQLSFYVPIISLIEQRFNCKPSKNIVAFFKSLNEHDGMDFDDYIDNWVKRCLKN